MATYIRKLKDLDGSYVLPATRSTAIYMSNNQKLEDYLSDMEDDLMSQISSSSVDFSRATASTSDVLSGETFYAGNKTLKTGTLSLTGTATAADVVRGKTFYANGTTRMTGSMTFEGTATASDVKLGKTFYADDHTLIRGTLTLSGNATAANVLSGQTFYSNNYTRQTGTMTNRGAWNGTVNPGSSITIPAGYHNGSGKVTANNPSGSWQMRFVSPNADNFDREFTFDLPDGAGTYGWGCTGYIYWGNENSGLRFEFADANYPMKLGNYQAFTFHGTVNLAVGYNKFRYRCWGGAVNFYYCRIR